ncbi:MAG: hypothetical protein M1815_005254 [Lichina confinis]|nr:MAG: hypothetical protein M1815_005254 [Lichina confinis]
MPGSINDSVFVSQIVEKRGYISIGPGDCEVDIDGDENDCNGDGPGHKQQTGPNGVQSQQPKGVPRQQGTPGRF